jgi:hypothetical protein
VIVALLILGYVSWLAITNPYPRRTDPPENAVAASKDVDWSWTDLDDRQLERFLRDSAS